MLDPGGGSHDVALLTPRGLTRLPLLPGVGHREVLVVLVDEVEPAVGDAAGVAEAARHITQEAQDVEAVEPRLSARDAGALGPRDRLQQ